MLWVPLTLATYLDEMVFMKDKLGGNSFLYNRIL